MIDKDVCFAPQYRSFRNSLNAPESGLAVLAKRACPPEDHAVAPFPLQPGPYPCIRRGGRNRQPTLEAWSEEANPRN